MSDFVIRRAVADDVPGIMRIYNQAILTSTATFDIEPKTLEDRMEWFAGHTDDYPLLVVAVDDKIAGWASIRPFGTRAAYRFTVENAIYVDDDYQGMGVGSALLGALIQVTRERGYHVIMALIVGGNAGSERLHSKHGFELVGNMREVGWKFGKWLDVLMYQKTLDVAAPGT